MRSRDLPVFPLVADPVRPEVSRDAPEVSVSLGPIGPEHGPKVGLITLGCDKNTKSEIANLGKFRVFF